MDKVRPKVAACMKRVSSTIWKVRVVTTRARVQTLMLPLRKQTRWTTILSTARIKT